MNQSSTYPQAVRVALRAALPIALVAAWAWGTGHGWISPRTLPSPADVVHALVRMTASGELLDNLAISLARVGAGFLAGAICGVLLGTLMNTGVGERCAVPSFRWLSCLPTLVWIPLLMMVLGIGELLKFVLIAKAVLIPVATNTLRGLQQVAPEHLELASVFQVTELKRLRYVQLPSAAGPIWSGLRLGLGHAWLTLVLVELLASSEGIGYLLVNGQQLFQLDVMLIGILVIGLVGYGLEAALRIAEARFLRWRHGAFE